MPVVEKPKDGIPVSLSICIATLSASKPLYDWHLGSGLSIVLMIFILINMIIESLADKKGGAK